MAVITVGGPPGSGTSTVCRILQERTGFEYTYAGQIFRESARERGMSLSDFGRLCENDPSVDKELDRRMLQLARDGKDRILEGRMTGPLCHREGIPSFKVYIDARERTRALRVMERDGGDLERVIDEMRRREISEVKRYMDYYGIDPKNEEFYDIVIDSSSMSPEAESDLIIERMEGSR